MFRAIYEDFGAIPGVDVLTGEPDQFGTLAAKADWSFIIAPETDGVLLDLVDYVLSVGGRLLGPAPEAISLTSDKFALFEHWKSRGVPTPETVLALPIDQLGPPGPPVPLERNSPCVSGPGSTVETAGPVPIVTLTDTNFPGALAKRGSVRTTFAVTVC